ncbi:MAG TPA: 3-phosphoshikimate 1-carboxyvinyltransferase [Candidatus Krumholzibacteria bacterium]|nr:3-phosphoshikimate 1-carboxyvinyltransferase [Candidatus Krumholzibacteria bacterium]
MSLVIHKASRLDGVLKVPGDKSISHRALILGAAARGRQTIDGIADSADVRTTMEALRAMGCFVESMPDGRTIVLSNSILPEFDIDAGNSGTTARLLAGFAAARARRCRIDGDASLRRRPMARIAEPLVRMGARMVLSNGGTLPATIEGGDLHGIRYEMPVASAQVKSAVLIAGLFAEGQTTVIDRIPTRDHTEIMLEAMGVEVARSGNTVSVRGGTPLEGIHVTVPGDFSSAAFFIVGATLIPGSRVLLPFTGVNPRRAGLLNVLERMGAKFSIDALQTGMEHAGDLSAAYSPLHSVSLKEPAEIASIIDEVPILAVAATQAEGRTEIRGAAELRYKESDRIEAIAHNLRAFGASVETFDDGIAIDGPAPLRGCRVSSYGDHRIAMAMAIAGLVAEGNTEIDDASVVEVSYPKFFADLRTLIR